MRRWLYAGRISIAVTLYAMAAIAVWQPSAEADGVPGRVLLRVIPGADIQALASNYGATVEDSLIGRNLYSFAPPNGANEQQFAKSLASDPRVIYSEQDTFIDSSEVRGEPFHFAFDKGPDPGTYVNAQAYKQVNLGKAQSMATGNGIVVAILDTGATFSHPALRSHYLPGYNALQPDLPPNDVPDGLANSGVGHGTMIAGIIACLAPNAALMPVRVLNGDGVGTMMDVAKGVHYAATHGARIITMSFGAPASSSALNDALDEAAAAGIVLVAAAGNDSSNQPPIPATRNGTVAVAAVEANNCKSSYSNYGSFVRVVAPGTGIRSTYWDGGYATWSGTSFAAPFVAAEAALMLSNQPTLLSETIVSSIRKTAHSVDSNNPAYKGQLGNGIIDIESAVKSQRH